MFQLNDYVFKSSGDYFFCGRVVALITKTSGVQRIVVENPHGLLFIFNPSQLTKTDRGNYIALSKR